jgi:LPS sulfotransferase NodH
VNIWILSERRTGSTFLCEIMNGTGLFDGKFKEWYVKFDHLDHVSDFYSCKGCKYEKTQTIPKNGKIHWDTMRMAFRTFENFVNSMSEPRLIRIIRENKLKMAASHLIAMKTKSYEIRNDEDYQKWKNTRVVASSFEMTEVYNNTIISQRRWEDEIKKNIAPHTTITYERLLENPIDELMNLMNFLGVKTSKEKLNTALDYAKNILFKHNHPDKIKVINALSRKIYL